MSWEYRFAKFIIDQATSQGCDLAHIRQVIGVTIYNRSLMDTPDQAAGLMNRLVSGIKDKTVKLAEDRLRKVEAAVRKLDEDHWQRNNPERQQREEGFLGQLTEAIAKLERELEAAKAGGDKKKIAEAQEALDARRAWLGALKN